MKHLFKRFRRISRQKNLVLNYSADQLNEEDANKLKDVFSSGQESGGLSNHQRGWGNKYINIIVISDKELLPEILDKIKRF